MLSFCDVEENVRWIKRCLSILDGSCNLKEKVNRKPIEAQDMTQPFQDMLSLCDESM